MVTADANTAAAEKMPSIFDQMAGAPMPDAAVGDDAPPREPAPEPAVVEDEPQEPAVETEAEPAGESPADGGEKAAEERPQAQQSTDEGDDLSDDERAWLESDRAKKILDARRRAWNAEARGELERNYSDKVVRSLSDPDVARSLNASERRAKNALQAAIESSVQQRLTAAGVQPDRPAEERYFDAYADVERQVLDSGLSAAELARQNPVLAQNYAQWMQYAASLGMPPTATVAQVRERWRAGRGQAAETRAQQLSTRLDPDELFSEFAARDTWAAMTEAERESLLPEKFKGDDPADVAAQMRERMGEINAEVKRRQQREAVLAKAAKVNEPVEAARRAARTAPPALHGRPTPAMDFQTLEAQYIAAVESGEIDRLPDLDRQYQQAVNARKRGGASWIAEAAR